MLERLPTGLVFNFPSPFFSLAFDFLRLAFNLLSAPLGLQFLILGSLSYLLFGFANCLLASALPFVLGLVAILCLLC
jgi:hypothetical protein